jgi:hypothetical protein
MSVTDGWVRAAAVQLGKRTVPVRHCDRSATQRTCAVTIRQQIVANQVVEQAEVEANCPPIQFPYSASVRRVSPLGGPSADPRTQKPSYV